MKKLFFLLAPIILLTCNLGCQNSPTATIISLPSFNVLLLDSNSILNSKQIPSGNPIVFIYFNTDCSHCQEETKTLLQHIDSLKNVQFYFLTGMSLDELKHYNDLYHLNNYKNIVVGKDYEFSFAKVFKPQTVPYMAIYNSEKHLVRIFKGETEMNSIFEAIRI